MIHHVVGAQGSVFASYTAPRLTYPQEPELAALPTEESESDILPFAIDGDNGPAGDATQGCSDMQTGKSFEMSFEMRLLAAA